MDDRPIGIFDSGVGGLTVLREVERFLPQEDIVYFGDTARVPYGNKSQSAIVKFSTENARFLLKKKVKAIVVACNTSSALALDHLENFFKVPIFGVIEAAVNKALKISKNRRIGVIGTRSTIASRAYELNLKKKDSQALVYTKSCPLFVPLVEEAVLSGKITDLVIHKYLAELKKKKIDTLILGCTHYPPLRKSIAYFMKGVSIIDSAKEVAVYTRRILADNRLSAAKSKKGKINFFVSDESDNFKKLARLFLKRNVSRPKVVSVSGHG